MRLGGVYGERYTWVVFLKRIGRDVVVLKGALKGLRKRRPTLAKVLRDAGIEEFRFERKKHGHTRVYAAKTSGGAARFVPLDDVEAEMKDETKLFAKKHKEAADRAVASASGERDKMKALATAENAMLVAGLEERKAAAVAEYDESIALTKARLPESLASIDAVFDGK